MRASSPGGRLRRVSQPWPMSVAGSGRMRLAMSAKYMSLAQSTRPPLTLQARSMRTVSSRGAGTPWTRSRATPPAG